MQALYGLAGRRAPSGAAYSIKPGPHARATTRCRAAGRNASRTIHLLPLPPRAPMGGVRALVLSITPFRFPAPDRRYQRLAVAVWVPAVRRGSGASRAQPTGRTWPGTPDTGRTVTSVCTPLLVRGLLALVDAPSAPVPRRLLLAVGALALLDACAQPETTHALFATRSPAPHGDPSPSPSPSAMAASPTPSPTPAAHPAAWHPPTPARPTPGVCPIVPGVVQRPGGPQHYLPCVGTNIALTIDDGPDPEWTPKILALLARYNIPATFCMIGRHAAAYPGLVHAVADAGHHIANHTYTHPIPLGAMAPPQIAAQLDAATEAITAAGAPHPTLFRAPGGEWSPAILAACATAGMRPLDWCVDTRDWSLPGVPHIVDTILTNTRPGSIILDHDGGGNRQQTVDALTIALPRLIDAGYVFTQP